MPSVAVGADRLAKIPSHLGRVDGLDHNTWDEAIQAGIGRKGNPVDEPGQYTGSVDEFT